MVELGPNCWMTPASIGVTCIIRATVLCATIGLPKALGIATHVELMPIDLVCKKARTPRAAILAEGICSASGAKAAPHPRLPGRHPRAPASAMAAAAKAAPKCKLVSSSMPCKYFGSAKGCHYVCLGGFRPRGGDPSSRRSEAGRNRPTLGLPPRNLPETTPTMVEPDRNSSIFAQASSKSAQVQSKPVKSHGGQARTASSLGPAQGSPKLVEPSPGSVEHARSLGRARLERHWPRLPERYAGVGGGTKLIARVDR